MRSLSRTLTRELLVVVVVAVAVGLAGYWLVTQSTGPPIDVAAATLDEADLAILEPSFALGLEEQEVEIVPIEASLPSALDGIDRVPTITRGWKEESTGRILILLAYRASLPVLAGEFYAGHVANVAPGASRQFDIEGPASALGFVGANGAEYRGTFHQGVLFFDILLRSPMPDDDRDIATVRRIVTASADKAPEGSTIGGLPSGPVFAAQAVGLALLMVGLCAMVPAMIAWVRDPLRRRPSSVGSPAGGPMDVRVVDVSDLAQRDRKRAGMRTTAILMGVAIAAPGLLPLSWPAGLLAVIAGGVIVFAAWRVPVDPERERDGGRRPRSASTGPFRARAYAIAAGTAVVLGLLLLCLAGVGVVTTSPAYADNLRFALAGAAFILFGAALHRYVRRLTAQTAAEARRQDSRPIVLFLRAFADDALRLRSARTRRAGVLDRLSPRGFDRFEEVVARSLDDWGPVVAVNPPGTELPPLGAARETVESDQDWRDVVRNHIREARVIVVGANRSDEAPGFAWELTTIGEYGRWSSTAFVLPPVGDAELRMAWSSFSNLMSAAVSRASDPEPVRVPPYTARALILCLTPEGTWIVITADRRNEWSYAAAFAAAMTSLAGEADGPAAQSDVSATARRL